MMRPLEIRAPEAIARLTGGQGFGHMEGASGEAGGQWAWSHGFHGADAGPTSVLSARLLWRGLRAVPQVEEK